MEKVDSEDQKKPQKPESPDPCSDWYYSDVSHEIRVLGRDVVIREISGSEYADIVNECTTISSDGQSRFDRTKYFKLMIKACVTRPEINASKLKAAPLLALMAAIEQTLGISGDAIKNLNLR